MEFGFCSGIGLAAACRVRHVIGLTRSEPLRMRCRVTTGVEHNRCARWRMQNRPELYSVTGTF